MLLNEIEENKKFSNKFLHKNKIRSEKRINPNILKSKRMRDTEETINYYDIVGLNNNNNYYDIKINEEMDIYNMSTSGKSISINKNDIEYNNDNEKNNSEEKILQLKIALQDQPYTTYFQYQNFY